MKSLLFVPNLLISEPCLCVFACQLRAQIVPFSSLKRACFELNCYRFRAQIVPVSSPTRYSFEPKSYRFRSRTVLLSSPVRAVINHFRTVSIRALAVKYVTRQSLAIFCRKSDSASITRKGYKTGSKMARIRLENGTETRLESGTNCAQKWQKPGTKKSANQAQNQRKKSFNSSVLGLKLGTQNGSNQGTTEETMLQK